jgi:hypothetical protein
LISLRKNKIDLIKERASIKKNIQDIDIKREKIDKNVNGKENFSKELFDMIRGIGKKERNLEPDIDPEEDRKSEEKLDKRIEELE